ASAITLRSRPSRMASVSQYTSTNRSLPLSLAERDSTWSSCPLPTLANLIFSTPAPALSLVIPTARCKKTRPELHNQLPSPQASALYFRQRIPLRASRSLRTPARSCSSTAATRRRTAGLSCALLFSRAARRMPSYGTSIQTLFLDGPVRPSWPTTKLATHLSAQRSL